MRDELKNENTYDQERLDQYVWRRTRKTGLSRRDVLKLLSITAGAAAAGLLQERRAYADGNPFVKPTPPDQFIILGGTNAEMRWEVMQSQGYTVPNANFFIRDHTLSPELDSNTWSLSVEGDGVSTPLSLSYADLLSMPTVTTTKFVECAGNGRVFFDIQQGTPAPGGQWHLGGIGVAEWTGVRLSDVLAAAGVLNTAVDVMPEGLDPEVGTNGHVRRPMSIEKALDDVLIVHTMNGCTLPPDHGFPARMLVPGWIGIANVKWVGKITVSQSPLFSLWNTTQYRLFGPTYPTEGVLLTNQMVKSAFELPFPASLTAGCHTITGRSWSGLTTICAVDVSTDGGATWQPATLGPRNDAEAWVQWSFNWRPCPGSYVLKARATDALGNQQPDTVPFNDLGYAFWAAVNHPVTVT